MHRLFRAIRRCSTIALRVPLANEDYFIFHPQPSQYHPPYGKCFCSTAHPNGNYPRKQRYVSYLDHCVNTYGLVTRKEVAVVLERILQKGHILKNEFLMIINCCGDVMVKESPKKRVEYVHEIWNSLCRLGVNLEICFYNALLKTYLENGHDFSPTEFLNSLKKRQLDPNTVTYEHLINKYGEMGDLDNVLHILACMRAKNMAISNGILNGVILCHFRKNNVEEAERVFRSIMDISDKCTPDTFVLLIRCLLEVGEKEQAMELLRRNNKTRDIKLYEEEYLKILYTLGSKRYHEEFDEVLTYVRRSPIYNAKAMKIIYKFLFDEEFTCAYKLTKHLVNSSRKYDYDSSFSSIGSFFFKFLIEHDKPASLVIDYCEKLARDDLNKKALSYAIRFSLEISKENMAISLLKAFHQKGNQIRPHYFWPLLVSRGKAKDESGLINVIFVMTSQFQITPCEVTLRDFVLPYMNRNESMVSISDRLKDCGCETANIVGAYVIRLLDRCKMEEAADLVQNHVANYAPQSLFQSLLSCYYLTENRKSFLKILKQIGKNIIWMEDTADIVVEGSFKEELTTLNYLQFIENMLVAIITKSIKSNNRNEVERFLTDIFENDIKINPNIAIIILSLINNIASERSLYLIRQITEDNPFESERFAKESILEETSALRISTSEDANEIISHIDRKTMKKRLPVERY